MLRWTIVFVLSAVALVNAVPTLSQEQPFRYYFYYGPTLSDSITYDVSNGYQILRHPNFDTSKPTVLYIHGWSHSQEDQSTEVETIVQAYLQRGNYNIIVLYWQGENSGSYMLNGIPTMKQAANVVGKSLVRMFDAGLNVDRLHLVGFSLGAHLAGHVGRVVNQESSNGINLKRISGLDPSFAGFYQNQDSHNSPINENDADFVDIIHTDAWLQGAPTRTGTVDFWPNGGKGVQPGCPHRSSDNYANIDLCSHNRAWVYWAESVGNQYNSKKFNAVKAANWRQFQQGRTSELNEDIVMGLYAPTGVSGDYYLQTNSASPHARGVAGVEYSNEHSRNAAYSRRY